MNEPFVQIMVAFLRDQTLSADARWLGTILATYADRSGIAWPGMVRLMREAHLSRHRLETARAELVKAGYVQIVQKRGERGRFLVARYQITRRVLRRSPFWRGSGPTGNPSDGPPVNGHGVRWT